MAAKKPRVFRGPAARFARGGEIILEVSFPDGSGCLVSLAAAADDNRIEIYRYSGPRAGRVVLPRKAAAVNGDESIRLIPAGDGGE